MKSIKTFSARIIFLILLCMLGIAKPIEAADDLAAQKEALDLIADFADRLCKDVPLEGSRSELELSGTATAELNGLIKKLVDLGIHGAAKYRKSEYQGVLRNDLATALEKSTDCKLEVFRELKDVLLKSVH